MKKISSMTLLTLGLLMVAIVSYAKPAPPQELSAILGEISELEERFESHNWDAARDSLHEIVTQFEEVSAGFKDDIPRSLTSRFLATAKGLDQFLEAEHEDKTEDSFIDLQVVLFDIMSHFEYRVHPIIEVLKTYIGEEAKEALEKGDLDGVESELREVVTFFTKNAQLLQQKGVGKDHIQLFMKTVGLAMKQTKAAETDALKSTLDELENQIETFQKAFV